MPNSGSRNTPSSARISSGTAKAVSPAMNSAARMTGRPTPNRIVLVSHQVTLSVNATSFTVRTSIPMINNVRIP